MLGGHVGVEVGHGELFGFCLMGSPFGKDADGETAKDPQDQDSIWVTDSALIFVG